MIKSNKGSITLYVTISCLFVILIGVSAYILTNNRQQAQLEQLAQLENLIQGDLNEDELYSTYDGGDVIPIYNAEQLAKIGTGEDVYINGKIYNYGLNKTYVVQKHIGYSVDYGRINELVQNGDIVFLKNWDTNLKIDRGEIKQYLSKDENKEYNVKVDLNIRSNTEIKEVKLYNQNEIVENVYTPTEEEWSTEIIMKINKNYKVKVTTIYGDEYIEKIKADFMITTANELLALARAVNSGETFEN